LRITSLILTFVILLGACQTNDAPTYVTALDQEATGAVLTPEAMGKLHNQVIMEWRRNGHNFLAATNTVLPSDAQITKEQQSEMMRHTHEQYLATGLIDLREGETLIPDPSRLVETMVRNGVLEPGDATAFRQWLQDPQTQYPFKGADVGRNVARRSFALWSTLYPDKRLTENGDAVLADAVGAILGSVFGGAGSLLVSTLLSLAATEGGSVQTNGGGSGAGGDNCEWFDGAYQCW